jgi:hypothetical protein
MEGMSSETVPASCSSPIQFGFVVFRSSDLLPKPAATRGVDWVY